MFIMAGQPANGEIWVWGLKTGVEIVLLQFIPGKITLQFL